mmetsp:Transcript_91344/g.212463  ORF Transcript_91344/g.212463 Transcript_91344/m.212463 type:complete len:240 (-) Transcript_91344:1043-1762(-)
MSSLRVVNFRPRIHSLRYSEHFDFLNHSYLTSSKPSSFDGIVNLVKVVLKAHAVMSGVEPFRNHGLFSSSVSWTCGGCSSSILSSSSSASSSSSPSRRSPPLSSSSPASFCCSAPSATGFLPPSSSLLAASPSCCFLASSAAVASTAFFAALMALLCSRSRSLCCFSASRLRMISVCLALNSMSALSCFSFNKTECTFSLKSLVGSPTMTCATVLKWGAQNRLSASLRSSSTKLAFTSM